MSEQTKAWYESKTVWGGIVAAVSGLGASFGLIVDQAALIDMLAGIGAAIGGLIAIYGRFVADSPIRISRGNSDTQAD